VISAQTPGGTINQPVPLTLTVTQPVTPPPPPPAAVSPSGLPSSMTFAGTAGAAITPQTVSFTFASPVSWSANVGAPFYIDPNTVPSGNNSKSGTLQIDVLNSNQSANGTLTITGTGVTSYSVPITLAVTTPSCTPVNGTWSGCGGTAVCDGASCGGICSGTPPACKSACPATCSTAVTTFSVATSVCPNGIGCSETNDCGTTTGCASPYGCTAGAPATSCQAYQNDCVASQCTMSSAGTSNQLSANVSADDVNQTANILVNLQGLLQNLENLILRR
jgi:hypothetical protein